jgi:hypothetical protein
MRPSIPNICFRASKDEMHGKFFPGTFARATSMTGVNKRRKNEMKFLAKPGTQNWNFPM